MLSMSNINTTNPGGYRLFAHAGMAWIYFTFILFLVTRETVYYINLRQAFLLAPVYANRISSRTVLFTCVPKPYLDEAKLRKTFGDSVRRVWITADTEALDKLVEERDNVAHRLEGAEVKLIKAANGARLKAEKGASSNDEELVAMGDRVGEEQAAESGSLAARWVPAKKRPTHKLGKFGLIGKKVDTINWCRTRLETLIPEVEAAQAAYRAGENTPNGSVFIEFARQSDAQAAYQTLSHHQALHMSPRFIGVQPKEIVWKSLKISWLSLVIRKFAVLGFVTALIIFWAIPVAFVGLVSNITYLESYSWLAWLKAIPTVIMGVVSGLLPSVLLALLMSLVPVFMRIAAKLAGNPTLSRVELFTQNAYFAFQVIQVFLVVTVAASASALVKTIIDDPTSIASTLAAKIPTASNFYINYFMVQGLTVASGVISQVVGFVIFTLMYKFLASTPRKMYAKWANLSALSWGSILPVFTNIAVVGIVYSIIAPLVLVFATIGMSFFYLAYRYNIMFVTDSQIDTKGLIYPRALQQLLAGIYIAEVVLLGLFGVSTAIGPIIMMVVLIVFTALYHITLNSAFDPLLINLPKSVETEEEAILLDHGYDNGHVGGESKLSAEKDGRVAPVAETKKPNFITKFFKPHIYSDYATLRKLVPHDLLDADNLYDELTESNAYYPPSVSSETPLLWIPRDDGGISRQEVFHTSRVIPITDEGCSFNAKNKMVWDTEGARPPLWSPKVYY